MSPELGIALVVTLLWGPTALWLAYRTIRGRQGRQPFDPFIAVSVPVRTTQRTRDELDAQVESDGFWVCATCRSLNLREANRCYSCRTAKGIPGQQTPGGLPVSRGYPVMADGITGRQRPGEMPVSRGYPVMADGIARSPGGLQGNRGVPVMAPGLARSPGESARATAAVAVASNPTPAHEILVRASLHDASSSLLEAPEGVPVCPFIGWRDDPSTRYDFPDPANLCHATSQQGTMAAASARRIPTGGGDHRRPQPIDPEHQKSRCLTAAHGMCARYPGVEVVAATR
jgi:hypothetical protein